MVKDEVVSPMRPSMSVFARSNGVLWRIPTLALLSLLTLPQFGCGGDKTSEDDVGMYKLVLSNPSEFGEAVFISPSQSFPSDPDTFSDTVKGTSDVQIHGADDKTVELRCELIVLDVTRHGVMRIHLNSVPMSLEDSYKCAIDSCDIFTVDRKKFDQWWMNKEYSKVGGSIQHNGGREDFSSTVEIRSSFEDDLPWRVRVEINTQIAGDEVQKLFERVDAD